MFHKKPEMCQNVQALACKSFLFALNIYRFNNLKRCKVHTARLNADKLILSQLFSNASTSCTGGGVISFA